MLLRWLRVALLQLIWALEMHCLGDYYSRCAALSHPRHWFRNTHPHHWLRNTRFVRAHTVIGQSRTLFEASLWSWRWLCTPTAPKPSFRRW